MDTSSYRLENYGKNTTLDVLVNGDNYENIREDYIQALREYNIGVVNFDNKEVIKENLLRLERIKT